MNTTWKFVTPLCLFLFAVQALGDETDAWGVPCELLDGTKVTIRSLAIVGDRISGKGAPADLTLDDLRSIETYDDDEWLVSRSFPGETGIAFVELQHGQLTAKKVSIANEVVKIEWLGGPPLELPVDLLRGFRVELLAQSAEYEKSLSAPPTDLDRIFIKDDDGQVSSISGLVDSLDAENLKFEAGGQTRSLSREKIHGVVFAQPVPVKPSARCLVTFRDSSHLGGDNLTLSDGKAALSLNKKIEVKFDWANVQRVAIRSNRMAFLSDLPFAKEEQTPIVTLPLPAQRDKSVSGSWLKVGLKPFDKGLGVHARSVLTFATDGKWDLFIAGIGLDEAANGKGDCVFVVLADGESIFERRVQNRGGIDFAAEIKLPITGCRELTLIVEPGAGLDLADHANWCDARLIKNK